MADPVCAACNPHGHSLYSPQWRPIHTITATEQSSIITDVWSTVMGMCLSACLSVGLHISAITRQNLTDSLFSLALAVARSSSDGVVIRYVLPVLWTTSCFRFLTMGSTERYVYSQSTIAQQPYCIEFQPLQPATSASKHCELGIGGKVCYVRLPCLNCRASASSTEL